MNKKYKTLTNKTMTNITCLLGLFILGNKKFYLYKKYDSIKYSQYQGDVNIQRVLFTHLHFKDNQCIT